MTILNKPVQRETAELRRCLTCRNAYPPADLDEFGDCPECHHRGPIGFPDVEPSEPKQGDQLSLF